MMKTDVVDHPCLTCSLLDCDDASERCGLRRAIGAYRRRKEAAVHG